MRLKSFWLRRGQKQLGKAQVKSVTLPPVGRSRTAPTMPALLAAADGLLRCDFDLKNMLRFKDWRGKVKERKSKKSEIKTENVL